MVRVVQRPRRWSLSLAVAVLAFLPFSGGQAQTVSFDFNTSGQLSTSFNFSHNGVAIGSIPYLQSPTGGLFQSGSVTVLAPSSDTAADVTAVLRTRSFDFSKPGAQLTISEFVQAIGISGGGGRLLQLGFVSSSTASLNNVPGTAFMSLRLGTVGSSGTTYTPQFQDKTGLGNAVATGLVPNLTLTQGDWYQLTGTFSNIGGGKFQASGMLQDFGPTGDSAAGWIFPFPLQTFTNDDMTADEAVWPAFRSFRNDGAGALDNLVVRAVPEPSMGLLWLLGAAALVLAKGIVHCQSASFRGCAQRP